MRSFKWSEIVRLLVVASCLGRGATLLAMQEAAAPPAESVVAAEQQEAVNGEDDAYNVGLERLNAERAAAGELLVKKLQPQREKLRQEFDKAKVELVELMGKLRADPGNRVLKAAYEEKLSGTMVNANRLLKEWTDQAPDARTALAAYEARLAEARVQSTSKLNEVTLQAAEWVQSKTEAENRLQAIAEHHRELVESGQPLPPDVKDDVQSLQVELENAALRQAISASVQREHARTLRMIEQYEAGLADLRKELELSFVRATNAQSALAKVAEARLAKINNEQLADALAELIKLNTMHGKAEIDFSQLLSSDLLADSPDNDFAADLKTGSDKGQEDARRILEKYLPKPEKQETNDATAGT
ncbi:MAG: hypothetical protein ACKO3T_23350 [Planctomycetaceae bacterium]